MQMSGAKGFTWSTPAGTAPASASPSKDTRGIIDAILSGAINEAPTKTIPHFGFEGAHPALPGVDPAILDPRDTYADAAQWEKAKDLAQRFIKNFC